MAKATWHIVDVRAIWIREFARALSKLEPVCAWLPRISWTGRLETLTTERDLGEGLTASEFPLQRGFARLPFRLMAGEAQRMAGRLEAREGDKESPLILTSPHYADLASVWPGPRIYYATDMFRFGGERQSTIEALERRMCAQATLICPNSGRIAEYMRQKLGAPADRIVIIPNATRAANIRPHFNDSNGQPPAELSKTPGPIAGVIGNLSLNVDWLFLEEVIRSTAWLHWLFVGPADMPIADRQQRLARERVLNRPEQVCSVGYKPYGKLFRYARCLDVAVLPYRGVEPTCSGSSTRFYEHLAAGAPMVATRGSEELLHKEPLLKLAASPAEMTAYLEQLKQTGFRDGLEELRWRTSREETWEARAQSMRHALAEVLKKRK